MATVTVSRSIDVESLKQRLDILEERIARLEERLERLEDEFAEVSDIAEYTYGKIQSEIIGIR